jgi:predicted alpha-1,2-mannosidase
MLKISRFLSMVAVLLCLQAYLQAQHARFVDPFLGSSGGGNVFPGASLPFGMLKAGPDTGGNTANAGWTPDEAINGFSQTHVSGTGGGAKYGNILIQPTTGAIAPEDHGSGRSNERASAGYYGVMLTRYNVGVEIASARRSAIYRIAYPAASKANLLIDAGHCLSSGLKQNEAQSLASSTVAILSPTEVEGSTSVTGGWNQQPNVYTVYFYAVTDTPAETFGTWRGSTLHPGSRLESAASRSKTGAWLQFRTQAAQVVYLKIGISFLSREQAKRNAMSEISGFDFAGVRKTAEETWDKALAPISIDGASTDDLRQFYTALYHTMLMPTDRSGENPLFQSQEPSYDDFYAIWDTFRTSSPLLTLISEERESAIVRSLVDLYRHEGWLPDARSGNYNGRVQGGTDADMTVVDGYLKHLPGIDWETAYRAVVHDAEQTSPNPVKEGRGDLDDWRKLGYLTIEGTDRPASKHMEYAANDYAIALLAKGLGKNDDYLKYSRRAANWKNLWDTEAEDHGFSGFIWPRHRDGQWKTDFDPLLSGTWGSDNFYEGNSWTYSTFVPQDVEGLIRASGGRERFVERMDAFFDLPGRYDVGNEPGFLAPYLFLWAGRPDRTQSRVRSILAQSYHSGPRGLPGNDDSGAMSSWYVFGKLGFYPNAAQDVYLIGSPAFSRVNIHLSNGRTFVIETEGNSPSAPYIASATWNGSSYQRTWFTHEQLMQGGTLRLTMSSTPTHWGASEPPPSMTPR